MSNPEINQKITVNLADDSLKKGSSHKKSSKRRRWILISGFSLFLIITFVLTGAFFSYQALLSVEERVIEKEDKTPILQQLKYLVIPEDKKIQGEEDDRINFLLLGMGGEGHSSGIYLTDTIMVVSLKPSNHQVSMLSIPRDLVVEIPGEYGYRKINNANSIGMVQGYAGDGTQLTRKIIEEVTGVPIHYYVRLDFAGFRKIVDDLGGIDVEVDNSFVDYQYPDYNYGYQTISFEEGWQHLDGEEALQFARSRHGNNGEGSDFRRSLRQQKIIAAVKDRALSLNTIINPTIISSVINDFGNHLATNIEMWEMVRLVNMTAGINNDDVVNKVIDNSPNSPLHSEISDSGAYVLIPNAGLGDYSEIQAISKNIFFYHYITQENARIAIQNGTTESGLAQKISDELEEADYNVTKIGNAKDYDNEKTVVYDLSNGQKPKSVAALRDLFDANVSTTIPHYFIVPTLDDREITYDNIKSSLDNDDGLLNTENFDMRDIDIVIILGEDNTTEVKQANGENESTNIHLELLENI